MVRFNNGTGFILRLVSFCLILVLGECRVDFEKEVTLTKDQGVVLTQFKESVSRLNLPQEYMRDDIYLVKWLRARNVDLDQALSAFKDHLEWRTSTNFDNLTISDFSDFVRDYQVDVNGEDREGRPLLQIPFDEWNIRKAVLTGKRDRLILYFMYNMEQAWKKVVEAQKKGKRVTRATVVSNILRVNWAEHINPSCFPFYLGAVTTYDKNFPMFADDIWTINTPRIVHIVLNFVKSVMNEDTRNSLKIYGTNKSEWKRDLYKNIEPSQLLQVFGGRRKITMAKGVNKASESEEM